MSKYHKLITLDLRIGANRSGLLVGKGPAPEPLAGPLLMRPCVGALGGRPEVQGVRQGAQGAAPSLASLEPPGSLPGTQKSERGPRCSRCGSRSVM